MIENNDFEIEEEKRLKYELNLQLATEFISKMSDYVNCGRDLEPFIHAFKNEHRKLQQGMFMMMLKLMEAIAEDDYPTDARNKDSKEISQKILIGFKIVKRQDYINEGCSVSRADQYVQGIFAKPSNYLRTI